MGKKAHVTLAADHQTEPIDAAARSRSMVLLKLSPHRSVTFIRRYNVLTRFDSGFRRWPSQVIPFHLLLAGEKDTNRQFPSSHNPTRSPWVNQWQAVKVEISSLSPFIQLSFQQRNRCMTHLRPCTTSTPDAWSCPMIKPSMRQTIFMLHSSSPPLVSMLQCLLSCLMHLIHWTASLLFFLPPGV